MDTNSKSQSSMSNPNAVRIEPWGEGDIDILKKTVGDAAMTRYLGGPESDEQIARRQVIFEDLAASGEGRMFKIVLQATSEAVGSVGYWEKTWHDKPVYETGWFVISAFQGRSIAGKAVTQAIDMAKSDGKHQFLHAFPSVENEPSNAICRKLGFTLIEECQFEYPKGSFMQCNDWRLDLFAGQ